MVTSEGDTQSNPWLRASEIITHQRRMQLKYPYRLDQD